MISVFQEYGPNSFVRPMISFANDKYPDHVFPGAGGFRNAVGRDT